ncbi:hypothetical protein B0H14DRAFT_3160061 [Mycena olivaceomarginata]|nr:hypothetical protein B0H14DRAFT_3160061 [Mycena olivaceomarginata]
MFLKSTQQTMATMILSFADTSRKADAIKGFVRITIFQTRSGMEKYGSGSAGRGMSAHNMASLWPILNMPPASPSNTEKRGRDEGEEDDVEGPGKLLQRMVQKIPQIWSQKATRPWCLGLEKPLFGQGSPRGSFPWPDVDQPPLQRSRHQDAPPRKERSDKGKKRDQPAPQRRGVQNAAPRKMRSVKGKKRGPCSA